MINFRCPSCDRLIAAKDTSAGLTVLCRECKAPAEVPTPFPEVDLGLVRGDGSVRLARRRKAGPSGAMVLGGLIGSVLNAIAFLTLLGLSLAFFGGMGVIIFLLGFIAFKMMVRPS